MGGKTQHVTLCSHQILTLIEDDPYLQTAVFSDQKIAMVFLLLSVEGLQTEAAACSMDYEPA